MEPLASQSALDQILNPTHTRMDNSKTASNPPNQMQATLDNSMQFGS